MTLARPIIPGATHFITRWCTQRTFFLRPRSIVHQAFEYVLAIAAERFRIELHAFVVLSNHWHALLTDREGTLAQFIQYVHKYVAKIINCSMGRFENLWSNEKTSIVTLEEEKDVQDKLCYLMANPVAAQLVEKYEEWPGICRMWQVGKTERLVERPGIYYRQSGKMPQLVTLQLVRPPDFDALSDVDASEAIRLGAE